MAHPVQIVVPQEAEVVTPQPAAAAREPSAATDQASQPAPVPTDPANGLTNVPVTAIRPNPHQPRSKFDQQALERLAESIRTAGVMQPITVRPRNDTLAGGVAGERSYELVAGERRWRAAQLAGLTHVPAIVRELDDRQVAEWALIENVQREDLNPIERAVAFRSLVEQFKLSHDQIAQRVGVDRSSISNLLRLLTLHPDIQQFVRDSVLSLGQAKALAALADHKHQLVVASRVIKSGLSVRQVESAVRDLVGALSQGGDAGTGGHPRFAASGTSEIKARAPHLQDLEQQIGQQLKTKVQVHPGRKKGTGSLVIHFYSLDQFDALLAKLGVQPE
jgi:ParB family chromosome partitioning protein